MKKAILLLLFVCSTVATFAQNQFILSGTVADASNASAWLSYLNDQDKWTTDSCALQNGVFSFKGNINGFSRSILTIYKGAFQPKDDHTANTATIFLEQSDITATGVYNHLNELKITGSKTQDENNALHAYIDEKNKGYDALVQNFTRVVNEVRAAKKQNRGNKVIDSLSVELTAIQKKIEPYKDRYENIVREYASKHTDSYISLVEMSIYTPVWPIDSIKLIYNQFSPRVQNTAMGKQVQKSIAAIAERSYNQPAKNFIAKDVNGKTLTLTDFKGKYVLLDFWASWCVPCREGMPHMKQVFKKYNKAGFEVIAIASDDNTPDDWRIAIRKDQTSLWHNILTGEDHNKDRASDVNSITNKFSIAVFPTKILIDKNGLIIGRYDETQTAVLDKKLAGIFEKKD